MRRKETGEERVARQSDIYVVCVFILHLFIQFLFVLPAVRIWFKCLCMLMFSFCCCMMNYFFLFLFHLFLFLFPPFLPLSLSFPFSNPCCMLAMKSLLVEVFKLHAVQLTSEDMRRLTTEDMWVTSVRLMSLYRLSFSSVSLCAKITKYKHRKDIISSVKNTTQGKLVCIT